MEENELNRVFMCRPSSSKTILVSSLITPVLCFYCQDCFHIPNVGLFMLSQFITGAMLNIHIFSCAFYLVYKHMSTVPLVARLIVMLSGVLICSLVAFPLLPDLLASKL